MKRTVSAAITAALFGIGAVVATTAPASAYVACNRFGDCWHSEARYHYAPSVGVTIHPDHWYFHRNWDRGRYRWRGYREGRGYYRNGIWVTF
jgi:hypothetical protein